MPKTTNMKHESMTHESMKHELQSLGWTLLAVILVNALVYGSIPW